MPVPQQARRAVGWPRWLTGRRTGAVTVVVKSHTSRGMAALRAALEPGAFA
jgi:hypothetical protein